MSQKYECPKCGSNSYEKGNINATGGTLAKIFDVQNKKFITVTCTNCGYTELYARKSSLAGNVFDFLTD